MTVRNLAGCMSVAVGCLAALPPVFGETEVMLFFDTEDYTNDRANDAIRDIANILTEEGVVGEFNVVGYLAQRIRELGRQDVVDALKPHEIGSQSLYHSVHPDICEATDLKDPGAAYDAAMREERHSVRLLKEVFGRDDVKFFCPPGNSVTYAGIEAYYDLGMRFYVGGGFTDYPGSDAYGTGGLAWRNNEGKGLWYFNLMWLPYTMAFRLEDLLPYPGDGEPNIPAILDRLARRDFVGLYMHPHMAVEKRHWDGINYAKRNLVEFGKWNVPPPRDEKDTETFYRRLRAFVHAAKSDRRFHFTSIGALEKSLMPRKAIRRADIPAIRRSLERNFTYVTDPASWCVSDCFAAAVRMLRGEGERIPGKAFGFVEKPVGVSSSVKVSADELRKAANQIDLSTYLPARIAVGDVQLGPADFLFAALEVLESGRREVELKPREQLGSFNEIPSLEKWRVAGGWGIHSDEFKDAYLSDRLRLQLWTLRREPKGRP